MDRNLGCFVYLKVVASLSTNQLANQGSIVDEINHQFTILGSGPQPMTILGLRSVIHFGDRGNLASNSIGVFYEEPSSFDERQQSFQADGKLWLPFSIQDSVNKGVDIRNIVSKSMNIDGRQWKILRIENERYVELLSNGPSHSCRLTSSADTVSGPFHRLDDDFPGLASDSIFAEDRLSRDWPVFTLGTQMKCSDRGHFKIVQDLWRSAGLFGQGVKVAVIDTGIDRNHFFLKDRTTWGFNTYSNNPDFQDTHGHGTHVAGNIASLFMRDEAKQTYFVWSYAPQCELFVLKAFEAQTSTESALADALRYCLDRKVNIINMSWYSYTELPAVKDLIVRCQQAGITLVAASGNNNSNQATYPSSWPGVIRVGGSVEGSCDAKASYANFGNITVAAVADGVWSNKLNGGQDQTVLSGTSQATPQVSGIATLCLQRNPSSSPTEIEARLRRFAIPLPGDWAGSGLVQATAVLEAMRLYPEFNSYLSLEAKLKADGVLPDPVVIGSSLSRLQSSAALASSVLTNTNITLATTHISGVVDNANALQEIQDTAAGQLATRSAYGNAPGGTVAIDENTLQGLLDLAASYNFRVSEVAGGSHSNGSAHYFGLAFDIDQINGAAVNSGNPDFQALMTLAKTKGAFKVLGPGDPQHDTHVHVAYATGFLHGVMRAESYCEDSQVSDSL